MKGAFQVAVPEEMGQPQQAEELMQGIEDLKKTKIGANMVQSATPPAPEIARQ